MTKIGIKSVKYTPACSSEEIEVEYEEISANDVIHEMWPKLEDKEKTIINAMIDKINKGDELLESIEYYLNSYNQDKLDIQAKIIIDNVLMIIENKIKVIKEDEANGED